MKTIFLAVVAVLVSTSLHAAQSVGVSADLETLHFSDLHLPPGARTFAPVLQDRVTQIHLLPDGGNFTLIGWADGPDQYVQAVATWTEILNRAGLKPGKANFKGGTYTIPYESRNGLVLRRFLAEPRQFKPKDEASLRANRAMILDALQKDGVPVVASYVVNVPDMLPTYAIYYLTRADSTRELGLAESRLRVLRRGEDIDFDILEGAGVRVLQKPENWILVYYGRAIGFVSGLAVTREGADKMLADRIKYFNEQGKQIIGSRIHELAPDPSSEYRYLINVYIFQ